MSDMIFSFIIYVQFFTYFEYSFIPQLLIFFIRNVFGNKNENTVSILNLDSARETCWLSLLYLEILLCEHEIIVRFVIPQNWITA